ncbi:hypothetical protein [Aliterella atlantica]|uniref:Uncharacterized protein n=1 Tax=Aliterella atlantica CENA595 TaxID=1618023 RepID=A0A0D8ZKW9_9CYAN|nr:hypothetical protein [Aliterella atlantica]KJH69483.1 hypothetical protein UH38_23550 [Aliterella atlantica CENA595]
MTEQPQPPSLEKVKQTAAKMQEICKRWDALIAVTDYMIGELEEQIRKQPNEIYRLKRAKQLLNIETEEVIK